MIFGKWVVVALFAIFGFSFLFHEKICKMKDNFFVTKQLLLASKYLSRLAISQKMGTVVPVV